VKRKGGFQLGLNAIVSFIISVMIFTFGVFLVTTFVDKAPLPAPDFCANDISTKIIHNEMFVACPRSLTLSESEMRRGFKVSYAYRNLAPDEVEMFFHIYEETLSNFEKQESPIIVPGNSNAQGIAIIGLQDSIDYDNNLDDVNYISVLLCKSAEPTATYDHLDDGCISQREIITIKKK